MRELSLHILDLIENSIRAKSSVIFVTIEFSGKNDSLSVGVEDDGEGFSVPPDVALDPFYTTKSGKRTGLGLSLFRAAAQRAGGELKLGKSPLGGASVTARMQGSHVDRSPLGDLAATFATAACTHPEIDLRVNLAWDGGSFSISSGQLAVSGGGRGDGLAVAREMSKCIQSAASRLGG